MNVTYGDPQGSVQGPKLFLLYINDMTQLIKYCKYHLYADDILLFKKIRPQEHNLDLDLLKQDVYNIYQWCKRNELTINIKKTKVQYFPRNRNIDCHQFEISNIIGLENNDIDYVSSFKD